MQARGCQGYCFTQYKYIAAWDSYFSSWICSCRKFELTANAIKPAMHISHTVFSRLRTSASSETDWFLCIHTIARNYVQFFSRLQHRLVKISIDKINIYTEYFTFAGTYLACDVKLWRRLLSVIRSTMGGCFIERHTNKGVRDERKWAGRGRSIIPLSEYNRQVRTPFRPLSPSYMPSSDYCQVTWGKSVQFDGTREAIRPLLVSYLPG